MTHEREIAEAAEGRIRADRMALGLPCLVDPLYGDMKEVKRLRAGWESVARREEELQQEIERLRAALSRIVNAETTAKNLGSPVLRAYSRRLAYGMVREARAALAGRKE